MESKVKLNKDSQQTTLFSRSDNKLPEMKFYLKKYMQHEIISKKLNKPLNKDFGFQNLDYNTF